MSIWAAPEEATYMWKIEKCVCRAVCFVLLPACSSQIVESDVVVVSVVARSWDSGDVLVLLRAFRRCVGRRRARPGCRGRHGQHGEHDT